MADENILPRDQNHVTTAGFENSLVAGDVRPGQIVVATGRIKVDSAGGGGGSPGGSNTDIQFNDSGSFGGEDSFTFDKATYTITLGVEGGTATIQSPTASSPNTAGVDLNLIAGNGNGTERGGIVTLKGGVSGGVGGPAQFQAFGGWASPIGNSGGTAKVEGGDGSGSNGNGGSIELITGSGAGSGLAGTLVIRDRTLAAASNGYVWTLTDQGSGTGGWTAAGSGSPGSPTDSIQFNSSGSFAGSSTLLFNGTDTITYGVENLASVIQAPDATTATNDGGGLSIFAGVGNTSGQGGNIGIAAGDGGDTGAGGSTEIFGGDGGATSGNGGDVTIQPGDAPVGSVGRIIVGPTGDDAFIVSKAFGGVLTSLDESAGWTIYGTDGVSNDVGGGTVALVGGNASASGNSVGGPVQLTAGTGHGTGAGGDITLAAGVAGQTASIGGSIIMRSGYATGGAPAGVIKMANTATGPYGILDFTSIASTDKTFTFPNTSGTLALVGGTTALTVGTTTIASGTDTRILYDNSGVLGEYTLTGTGTVVVMATSPTFTTGLTTPQVLATANDSGALGASGTAFSDLFLASGGVINWAAANVTLTQSSGILTQDHGELRITSANVGTNADSVPTLSSTSTLTNKTLTSPTIQTSPVLAAATNLKFTVPTADPSATGITTNEFNSGYSSTAIGDLVYLDSSATWQKADADASAATYSSMLGIALSVAASSAPVNVLLQGFFYGATALPTLTIGAPVYMSATAGAMTQTAPVTTDSATRVLGYGIHADKMYFNPSNDWITHT